MADIASAYPQPMGPGTAGMPVQPYMSTNQYGGVTTETKQKTPAQIEYEKQLLQAQGEQRRVGDAKLGDADIIDKANADKAQAAMAASGEMLEQRQRIIDAYKAKQAQLDEDVLKASKITDYWEDKSTPAKIISALAVGLGGFGAALTGGQNHAAQILENAQAADRQVKMDRLKAAVERKQISGDEYNRAIMMLDAQQKAQQDHLIRASEAIAAKVPAQRRIVEQFQADLREKQAQEGVDREQKLATSVSRHTGADVTSVTGTKDNGVANKPTESEQKTGFLAEQMAGELATIRRGARLTAGDLETIQADNLRSEAADTTGARSQIGALGVELGRSIGITPKSKYENLSPEKQKTANAWDNAVEKYARILTGAGMPVEEARRMALQNQPVAGDSADVIEQKLTRLESAAKQLRALSGPATESRLATTRKQEQPRGDEPNPYVKMPTAKVAEVISAIQEDLKKNPNDAVARAELRKIQEAAKKRKGGR